MERNALRVTTFGCFSIAASCCPADNSHILSDNSNRSKKLWALMQYLILHRDRAVPVSELFDALWQNSESSEASVNALKILVHRARLELNRLDVYSGKELILNRQGAYQWNNDIPMELDCDIFDRLYTESRDMSDNDRLDTILEAIKLYYGRFLPRSAAYLWVTPLYEHYHLRFTELCFEAASTLFAQKRDAELIELLSAAIEHAPFVESLHLHYIRALSRSGAHEQALEHYRSTAKKFYMQYGKAPSEQMLSLYKTINGTIRGFESDVNTVFQDLMSPFDLQGAFFCNLSVFCEICQLKVRESILNGSVSQLALITVSDAEGKHPGEKAISKLPDAVSQSLRVSDVFTQYSSRQFIVLIPAADFAYSSRIIERIERNFKAMLPRCGVELECSLMQLDASTVQTINTQDHTPIAL